MNNHNVKNIYTGVIIAPSGDNYENSNLFSKKRKLYS